MYCSDTLFLIKSEDNFIPLFLLGLYSPPFRLMSKGGEFWEIFMLLLAMGEDWGVLLRTNHFGMLVVYEEFVRKRRI